MLISNKHVHTESFAYANGNRIERSLI